MATPRTPPTPTPTAPPLSANNTREGCVCGRVRPYLCQLQGQAAQVALQGLPHVAQLRNLPLQGQAAQLRRQRAGGQQQLHAPSQGWPPLAPVLSLAFKPSET